MKDIHWDKLDEKKRAQMAAELTKLANKTAREAQKGPAKTGLTVKVKFMACRMIQQSVRATQPDSMDVQYWAEQGWLGKKRPWQTKQEAE